MSEPLTHDVIPVRRLQPGVLGAKRHLSKAFEVCAFLLVGAVLVGLIGFVN